MISRKLYWGFQTLLQPFESFVLGESHISQPNLTTDLMCSSCNAHNALAGVQVLHQLTTNFLNTKLLITYSFTVSWVRDHNTFLQNKKKNLQTLQPLIQKKALPTGMADKAASSGLRFHHLELAFQRIGIDGVVHILKETFNGNRVASNTRVLSQICNCFESRRKDETIVYGVSLFKIAVIALFETTEY